MNIYIKAFWIKNLFQSPYTLYRVMRDEHCYQTTIYETRFIDKATSFRDEMIERGIK